ncbi:ABC transporter substrate-binding protein [Salana multivorans]
MAGTAHATPPHAPPTRHRRRTRALAAGTVALLATALLAACGGGSGGVEEIRFTFSKREAIPFMTQVVKDFNASQNEIRVEMDTSGPDVISASFVRGNPPDLMLANYNFEVARFVQRCAVSDLSDTEAAQKINPDLLPLMEQYGACPGQITAIPYSVMSASVIYNKEIFAEHGLEVPTTWDELIAVCDALKAAGIDPFYATFADPWTVNQGWSDYSIGGSLDVLDFFGQMGAAGTEVGPDSAVSFEKDFLEPLEKMQYLADNYTNSDAASRTYDRGNVEFANGNGAMYLQGPWAFSEIAKTAPDLEVGSFPLPMTDDPADLAVRVNMDLAAMIPTGSNHQEAARVFMEYLFQEENITAYNESQLGFVPQIGGAEPSDPRVEGMIQYYNEGQIYQGPGVLIPRAIPTQNYMQAVALGDPAAPILRTMDKDWARLAFRQPAPEAEVTE